MVIRFEMMTPGENLNLKRMTEMRMTDIFEMSYQSPGKKRRLCSGEQARPGAGLTKPAIRASLVARSRTGTTGRGRASLSCRPPSDLGTEISRQGGWTPPSCPSTGSRQWATGPAVAGTVSRRGKAADAHSMPADSEQC